MFEQSVSGDSMTALERVAAYNKIQAINQSYLKSLFADGKRVIDIITQRKFLKGNLIDALLSFQHEPGAFESLYYVGDVEVPKPMYETIGIHIEEHYPDYKGYSLDSVPDEVLLDAFRATTTLTWKEGTAIKNIRENLTDYWEKKRAIGDKTLITSKQLDYAQRMFSQFLQYAPFAQYLDVPHVFQNIVQGVFDTEDKTTYQAKGLQDMVAFIGNDFIQPIEFKWTESSFRNFPNVARHLRYDLQQAFYVDLLQQQHPGVHIYNPIIFVISSPSIDDVVDNDILPTIFHLTLSDNDLTIGRYGYKSIRDILYGKNSVESMESFRNVLYGKNSIKSMVYDTFGYRHAIEFYHIKETTGVNDIFAEKGNYHIQGLYTIENDH